MIPSTSCIMCRRMVERDTIAKGLRGCRKYRRCDGIPAPEADLALVPAFRPFLLPTSFQASTSTLHRDERRWTIKRAITKSQTLPLQHKRKKLLVHQALPQRFEKRYVAFCELRLKKDPERRK